VFQKETQNVAAKGNYGFDKSWLYSNKMIALLIRYFRALKENKG
jgi:hypothetical protein